ncbi:MAG: hypothetical protein M0T77_06190 [Actinomycetota bacterium]|nr:hypothetical protein [Actinomycetota bacterium]
MQKRGYTRGIPKVTIYVPDAIYDELRARRLPLSQLAQRAFTEAIEQGANADWIAAARSRPIRPTAITSEALMAQVDEEFGA